MVQRQAMCVAHGEYVEQGFVYKPMGRVMWGGCQVCLAQEDAKREQAQQELMLAYERSVLEERLERSCLPKRFVGKVFENFVCQGKAQQQVFDLALRYTKHFDEMAAQGRGLIFLGGVGTGKSHLAAAILQRVMRKYQGLYLTVAEVVREVRGCWRKDAMWSEAQVLKRLVGVDLLVLDEVGKQYGTQGEEHILFDVLDGRYREMKPTILLGNVAADELEVFLGERVADRLRETSTAVVFGWRSYRHQPVVC